VNTAIIMITGYARSGTKLLNKILHQANLAQYTPELQFVENIWNIKDTSRIDPKTLNKMAQQQMMKLAYGEGLFQENDYRESLLAQLKNSINNGEITQGAQLYLSILQLIRGQYSHCLDSTPRNIYYIDEFLTLSDRFKFVFLLRDPRDCILSQKKKYKNYLRKKRYWEALRLWLNYNPILMAKLWARSFEIANTSKGEHCFIIQYERLTQQPKLVLNELSAYLKCTLGDINYTHINANNSEKWMAELPCSDVYWIQKTLSDFLNKAGYKEKPIGGWVVLYWFKILWYFLKMPLALILNLSRLKNPLDAILRRLSFNQ